MNRNSYKNEWTPIQDLDIRKKAELASILHFKEGYSVKEIADRFNLSESRIREYFKQNQETKEDNIF
jgi:transposase